MSVRNTSHVVHGRLTGSALELTVTDSPNMSILRRSTDALPILASLYMNRMRGPSKPVCTCLTQMAVHKISLFPQVGVFLHGFWNFIMQLANVRHL